MPLFFNKLHCHTLVAECKKMGQRQRV